MATQNPKTMPLARIDARRTNRIDHERMYARRICTGTAWRMVGTGAVLPTTSSRHEPHAQRVRSTSDTSPRRLERSSGWSAAGSERWYSTSGRSSASTRPSPTNRRISSGPAV